MYVLRSAGLSIPAFFLLAQTNISTDPKFPFYATAGGASPAPTMADPRFPSAGTLQKAPFRKRELSPQVTEGFPEQRRHEKPSGLASLGPLPSAEGRLFAGRRGRRPLRGIRPSDGRPYEKTGFAGRRGRRPLRGTRAGQAPPLRWLIRDFRPPEHFKRLPCLCRREAKGPLAYAGAKRKAPLPKGGCRGERSETRLGDNSCCLMRKVSLHRAGAVPLPLGKGGFFAGRRGRRPLRGTRAGQGPPPVR